MRQSRRNGFVVGLLLLASVAAGCGSDAGRVRTAVGAELTALQSPPEVVTVAAELAPVAPVATETAPPGPACDNVVHGGEYLSTVADRCGVSWQRLFNANPDIKNPSVVWDGLEVRVPDPAEQLPDRQPAQPAPAKATIRSSQPTAQRFAVEAVQSTPEQAWANPGSNQALGQNMAAAHGWTGWEWTSLDLLWSRESGWSETKWNNAGSGAYGIPQALPASKMAAYGADYMTNPLVQIAWGLDYIGGRYGSPSAAWVHFLAYGWY